MNIPENKLKNIPEKTLTEQKSVYDFFGKTVLIVDDVLVNVRLLAMFLKNTGAKLLFASNGSEAVNIFTSSSSVDMVLMDIDMPVMNGIDATREIKKIRRGIPVIIISTYHNPENMRLCFDAGCNKFMSKPCDRNELLMVINNLFIALNLNLLI